MGWVVDFVTIYTADLQVSKRFYVDLLEFPLIREMPNEFFQIGIAGVPICVDLQQNSGQNNNIGLEVDDLASTTAALQDKGLQLQRGSNPASKEEWLGVRDPDGNELIFLTHKS